MSETVKLTLGKVRNSFDTIVAHVGLSGSGKAKWFD